MTAAAPVLEARAVGHTVGATAILREVSLAIAPGEWVSLVGPSGCGKTTLLHLLGLLDRPTEGSVWLGGDEASRWSRGARARARLQRIGFVFQQLQLLDHLSARDNVALPAWRLGGSRRRALAAADAMLERVGLAGRARERTGVLSMGEAQRVALARALVNRPAIVLADEPTGSLDSASAAQVLDALREVRETGGALLVVTHDDTVAQRADRSLCMRDGRLIH
jgi:ABC-type lipoprotein export system ATPase subunit